MVESFFDNKSECLTIKIKGRFDYSCHKVFKDAFMEVSTANSYEVDFSEVLYLDSSALGMLLLLRDYAGGSSAEVKLTHANSAVIEILTIANFHRLFEIS